MSDQNETEAQNAEEARKRRREELMAKLASKTEAQNSDEATKRHRGARPMPAAIQRPASLVSARANTQKVISPGLTAAMPALQGISSQCGGRIEETVTRFCCSISASRKACSNAVS